MVNLKTVIVQTIVLLIIVIFISYGIVALKNSEINSLKEEILIIDSAIDSLTDEKDNLSNQVDSLNDQIDSLTLLNGQNCREIDQYYGMWTSIEGEEPDNFGPCKIFYNNGIVLDFFKNYSTLYIYQSYEVVGSTLTLEMDNGYTQKFKVKFEDFAPNVRTMTLTSIDTDISATYVGYDLVKYT